VPPNASPAESWELPEVEEKKLGGEVGYRIILAKHGDEVRINVVKSIKSNMTLIMVDKPQPSYNLLNVMK